ncbi:MAG TPA: hypothetical protein PK402_00070 [Tepidisphaeraceae bacterium]|nr:hypothetical protein [Tepidisphaeraceae bacterium]
MTPIQLHFRRAVALHFVLLMVLVLGVVLLISTRLMRQLDEQRKQSQRIDVSAMQAGTLIQVMWIDVWRAGTMSATDSTLTLDHAGEKIEWRVEGEQLIRKSSEGERRLPCGPIKQIALSNHRVELLGGDSPIVFVNFIQESSR